MPGYVIAHRKQDEMTNPSAVASPPKSAISAPAAVPPRNFSRAAIDIVKMPSGTAKPDWRKAHSKVPSCLCGKKATISVTLAVRPGKYGIPPNAVTGTRPGDKSTDDTVAA